MDLCGLMHEIKVKPWDQTQFLNAREEWSDLLARSNSDKLFMSWEWLSSWWDIFSDTDCMQLRLLVAYDSRDTLLGIAPLYLMNATEKKFVKTKRLQFMGNCWRGQATMRTELLDFITDKDYSVQVVTAFYEYINRLPDWDEFILSDLDKNSETYRVLMSKKILDHAYYRLAEENKSYYLVLENNFEEFCRNLGKNTRLKLFNRRKLLKNTGKVVFEEFNDGDLSSYFELLNSLHIMRWGTAIFEGKQLAFNQKIAELMSARNALHFSVLKLDNEPISIQYNFVVDKHEYNIQAGFNENFHKKISLGYLHFGYAIESAFKRGVTIYDFLVGEGKNTQYKEKLTRTTLQTVSMQIIRNRWAKFLYYFYDVYCKWVLKRDMQ